MVDQKKVLDADDIAYVADMLRAIVWVKEDLNIESPETRQCLETSLSIAEASLRRAVSEMKLSQGH